MDILNTGKRIRYFRILNGMTQKALGMAAGFPEKSADVRIAQYETGTRKPKHDVIVSLANVFNVSPMVLEVPSIKNSTELCYLLFALEDEFGVVLYPQPGNYMEEICEPITLWQHQRELLEAGGICYEEYDHWRYHYR